MKSPVSQVFFDGLIGPTYTFGGLSPGNLASMESGSSVSNPRQAALQGLYKMKMLADMGVHQALLPPQERPDIYTLRQAGFFGNEMQVLQKAFRDAPELLFACGSAANAWAANSATITPSADSSDGRVHITPANLVTHLHRSIEVDTTTMTLFACFPDPDAFCHHDPLPKQIALADEGSANVLHLSQNLSDPGVHLFVYDRYGLGHHDTPLPKHFPMRQTREASEAIARLHRLNPINTLFAQQHPEAIDAGVFHNDLAALALRNVLIYHEKAWLDPKSVINALDERLDLCAIKITEKELPLTDLVSSYLCNAQLIALPDQQMALIAATQTRDNPKAASIIQRIIEGNNPITKVIYFDLSQSLRNGGGPRCLTLSALLTDSELRSAYPTLFLNDGLYSELVDWIHRNYREQLQPGDLADPQLLFETRRALDELTDILDLGPLYPFQQE